MLIYVDIGQNWIGEMELAEILIDEAVNCGTDLVKFQLYDHKKLYGDLPDYSLSQKQATDLFNYGKDIGIEVFFSVFDVERVKWCEEMGVKRYKIACTMRDMEVIDAISMTRKPVIISSQVPTTWDTLYCVPEYPATNVVLPSFARFTGYSDHTIGLDKCKEAIDKGARIIEKHFCYDHSTGIDAPWSMTPSELRELSEYAKKRQLVV